MFKKILILFAILGVVAGFVIFGIPALKDLKNRDMTKTTAKSDIPEQNLTGGRVVTLDISIESPCRNMIEDTLLPNCQNATVCQTTCETSGCQFFGLDYAGSSFAKGKCECVCHEENKIKKALNPK
jgi:hypothetical protein